MVIVDKVFFIQNYTIYAGEPSLINLRVITFYDVDLCNKYIYNIDIGFRPK